MPNTTNFNWSTPADTDLVKDGAAAIRTLGNSIDTSMAELKGGTTGQVLSKTSNTDMDFTWVAQDDSNAIQNAIVDAKGDLISATGNDTPARLAVGTNGQVLTADSTQSTGLKWANATGGVTWTQRLASQANSFTAIAYNGSNLYVAVGSAGLLYSSTDGQTWTSRTSGFGANNINYVAFGNGLFVAVGNNGTITTSTDGTTWTARTANMGTAGIYSVTYANSLWVAVGANGGTTNTGGITYSTDGLTWTRKSQSITVGPNYYDVTWNGTNWIVVTNSSTNNYLYASTPSGTWTAGADTTNDNWRIIWDGTRHIVWQGSSSAKEPKYSTSTTLGTTTAYNVGHRIGDYVGQASLYNGIIYCYNGNYWGTITPGSSANLVMSAAALAPTNQIVSSPYINANNVSTIFAGAAGIIIANQTGIWTSF